jgi:hypothetical protein
MSSDDDDDELLVAMAAVRPTVATRPGPAVASRSRTTWISIYKVEQGKKIVSARFLSEDNWQDKLLIRHLLIHKPYTASHGSRTSEWDKVRDAIVLEEIGEGTLAFGSHMPVRTLKARFTQYMDFAKSEQSLAPGRSGIVEPPSEIRDGIENIWEEYSYGKNMGK